MNYKESPPKRIGKRAGKLGCLQNLGFIPNNNPINKGGIQFWVHFNAKFVFPHLDNPTMCIKWDLHVLPQKHGIIKSHRRKVTGRGLKMGFFYKVLRNSYLGEFLPQTNTWDHFGFGERPWVQWKYFQPCTVWCTWVHLKKKEKKKRGEK